MDRAEEIGLVAWLDEYVRDLRGKDPEANDQAATSLSGVARLLSDMFDARRSAGSARVDARAAAEQVVDEICSAVGKHFGYAMTLDRSGVYRAAAAIITAHSAPPALTEEERSLVETATDMLDAEPTHPLGLTGLEKRMLAIITRLTS